MGSRKYRLLKGDCLEKLKEIPDNSIDSVVTDPPYHLQSIVKRFGKKGSAPAKDKDGLFKRHSRGFMGQQWDGGDIAFKPEVWMECLRVLKPGGHLLAFGATRNYHRMTCAIEDAGFEIRDCIMWVYGQGMPKSHNLGEGRGTSLKPSLEPIVLSRKGVEGTIASNVLKWGTGCLNIDECRVKGDDRISGSGHPVMKEGWNRPWMNDSIKMEEHLTKIKEGLGKANNLGRWPSNLIHDGSDEVTSLFPKSKDSVAGKSQRKKKDGITMRGLGPVKEPWGGYGGEGSAARFFYCAKPSSSEKKDNSHSTVKPLKLMSYLIKLVTPPGGTVLDPFAGSGTTGLAAIQGGYFPILIEREENYQKIIENRLTDRTEELFDELEI